MSKKVEQVFYGELPLWAGNYYWIRDCYAVFCNQDWEEEAESIIKDAFLETAYSCFALAELYRFGFCSKLPGVSVDVHFTKAAYWQMRGLRCGSAQEFSNQTDFSDDAYLYPKEEYKVHLNSEMLTMDYLQDLACFLDNEWKKVKGHNQENCIRDYVRYVREQDAERDPGGCWSSDFESLDEALNRDRFGGEKEKEEEVSLDSSLQFKIKTMFTQAKHFIDRLINSCSSCKI